MRNLALALALVLVCAAATPAEEKYKEHTIRGMGYDRHAVEQLLDESSVPAEAYVDKVIGKLKGKFKLDKSKKVEDAVLDFIDKHRHAFGLKEPKRELRKEEGKGFGFQQVYNGVPVYQHSVGIFRDKDGDIQMVLSNLVPTPDIDTTPLVTEEEAIDIASKDRQSSQPGKITHTMAILYIYRGPKLAYLVSFLQGFSQWVYFIDAKTGKIIRKDNVDSK